jgi:hypothetical protein
LKPETAVKMNTMKGSIIKFPSRKISLGFTQTPRLRTCAIDQKDPPDLSSASSKPPKLDPATLNSPAAMKIFQQAQKNILELNESRLKALTELEAAKEKIAELESRLQRTADSGASSSSSSSTPSSSSQPLVGSITIIYETTWHKAFIHYTAAGANNNNDDNINTIPKAKDDEWGQWTELPGQHMSEIHIDRYVITVPAIKMEFVMTDGQGGWDHPDGDISRNYILEEPGTYLLRESIVRKL